jgi:hypothetical protein
MLKRRRRATVDADGAYFDSSGSSAAYFANRTPERPEAMGRQPIGLISHPWGWGKATVRGVKVHRSGLAQFSPFIDNGADLTDGVQLNGIAGDHGSAEPNRIELHPTDRRHRGTNHGGGASTTGPQSSRQCRAAGGYR